MSTAAVLVDRSRVPHQGAGWHLGSNYTSDYLVTAGRMKCSQWPEQDSRLLLETFPLLLRIISSGWEANHHESLLLCKINISSPKLLKSVISH